MEPIFTGRELSKKTKFGYPRCTTVREDRYFANVAKRHRSQSDVKLNAEFQRATGRWIYTQTVMKRLYQANLKACRPAVRPV